MGPAATWLGGEANLCAANRPNATKPKVTNAAITPTVVFIASLTRTIAALNSGSRACQDEADVTTLTCCLSPTWLRLQAGPNMLRITSHAMLAAVSFWHNLSSGLRSSSAIVMM